MGRTSCNRTVNFKAPPRLLGELIDVKITEARAHSLRGQLCDEQAPGAARAIDPNTSQDKNLYAGISP
jgi:tRNA-2-methylthio-N6-dimethylallyladenosine synthase